MDAAAPREGAEAEQSDTPPCWGSQTTAQGLGSIAPLILEG